MKKNCNYCAALQQSIVDLGCYCGLGHEIEELTSYHNVPTSYKPLEECEKPKTIKKYNSLALERSRSHVY